jgi:predicted nucleic acid-binding protein
VTYNLTKMYQIHGLGRGNDKGDLYDLAHFIDGCNADYLVTDDKGFREICDLAKWRPFQHITFQEFCEKVLKN